MTEREIIKLDILIYENNDGSWTSEVRPFMPIFAKPFVQYTRPTRDEVAELLARWLIYENPNRKDVVTHD